MQVCADFRALQRAQLLCQPGGSLLPLGSNRRYGIAMLAPLRACAAQLMLMQHRSLYYLVPLRHSFGLLRLGHQHRSEWGKVPSHHELTAQPEWEAGRE
eukprot:scaffold162697_cov29-Tisochrysis_lutea.AAC.2